MQKITFKQFITEAPLGDYQTIGNFDKAYSFKHKTDRIMVTSPKAIENVRRKFGKTKYTINMFFVNKPEARGKSERGKVDLEWVEENFGEDVSNAIKPYYNKEDNINVVYTTDTGAARVPMTPWIMAHRLGHALSRSGGWYNNGKQFESYQRVIDTIVNFLEEIFSEVYGISSAQKLKVDMFGPKDRKVQLWMKHFFHELCTFKSARDKNLRDYFEVYNELFAQFVIEGKVKFNKLPKTFGVSGWGKYPLRAKNDEILEEYQNTVDTLANTLDYYFDELLSQATEGVLIM